MRILDQIKIKDFKSFTQEIIKFDDITCIVGANETGKTNLLKAIYHLSREDRNKPFEPDDLRLGAENYPNGEIVLEFTISLKENLIPFLVKKERNLIGKTFTLNKIGKPKLAPRWDGILNCSSVGFKEVILIKNKTKFSQELNQKVSTEKIQEWKNDGWFIKNGTFNLRTNPFARLLHGEIIEVLKGQALLDFYRDKVRDGILENIHVYPWSYREENFLREIIPLAEFIPDHNKFLSVKNMFLIAGWKPSDFASNLQNQSPTVYKNLLGSVKREINSLIKNHWSSHKNLTIEIEHQGTHLAIHLHEPGSSTPPEFRSDGLKWFLTFLINFRAQSKTLSNYILLIDEPGLYLHPKGQKDVLLEAENLSQKNQVIYTTHQTFLINKNKADSVRIIQRETERGGSLARNPFYASKVSDVLDPKKILTDRLLREALGFKVSDISPINEKNILVEGVFDRDVLQILNDRWRIIDMNDISIIACGPASEIARHARLYIANDLKVVCFYDSDDAGKSAYKNNNAVKEEMKRQIRDVVRDKDFETMEDLIPDEVFNEADKQWRQKWEIKDATEVKRPRMKSINKFINNNLKIEMKRSLEDFIIQSLKQYLSKKNEGLDKLKELLQDLNNRCK